MRLYNASDLHPRPIVHFAGIGGGKVMDITHVIPRESNIAHYRPSYMVVQFGGNDLDSAGIAVSENIETLVLRISRMTLVRYWS